MKEWGYGAGYQHAHLADDALTDMECLPSALIGKRYYEPTLRGMEQKIHDRLEQIRLKRKHDV
jgi:putative ATPase